MTDTVPPEGRVATASQVIAAQLRRLRADRRLSAAQLAERCQHLGAAAITTNVIVNTENQRRAVTVEDLLVFALALDVPPTHLLSPTPPRPRTTPRGSTRPDLGAPALAITSTVSVADPVLVRRWLRGQQPLPDTDPARYYAAARADEPTPDASPPMSQDAGARLAAQFDREAEHFVTTVRDQVNGLLTGLETAVKDGGSKEEVLKTLTQARGRLGSSTT